MVDIRNIIEPALLYFYFSTLGAGQLILGYCLGRWANFAFRLIPLLFILPYGYWWVMCSDHGFDIFVMGNSIYSAALTFGIAFGRSTKTGMNSSKTCTWFAL